MRPIDADALMDDIKRDSKKAIEEGDKFGSFWLGYAAGLVIKKPTVQQEPTDEQVLDYCKKRDLHLVTYDLFQSIRLNHKVSFGDKDHVWIDGKQYISLPRFQEAVKEAGPKEGYWKKDETDDCPPVFQQFRICSECGCIKLSETNFCPDCGAHMRGKHNV